MRGESWKFQWMRQCRARKGTKRHFPIQETEAKSCESHKIPKKQSMHVIVEVHRVHEKAFGIYRKIKKITSQAKDIIRRHITIGCTSFSDASSDAAVDKAWKKFETIPAWQLDKVKSKREVILETQRDKKESPHCYIDGHLSSEECRVRTQNSEV